MTKALFVPLCEIMFLSHNLPQKILLANIKIICQGQPGSRKLAIIHGHKTLSKSTKAILFMSESTKDRTSSLCELLRIPNFVQGHWSEIL